MLLKHSILAQSWKASTTDSDFPSLRPERRTCHFFRRMEVHSACPRRGSPHPKLSSAEL